MQLWISQLWPISSFKNFNQGSAIQKFNAYKDNQKKINLLQIPILNWIILCIFSFYGIYISEFLQKTVAPNFVFLVAILGIFFVFCIITLLILSIAYIFLKNVEVKLVFNH